MDLLSQLAALYSREGDAVMDRDWARARSWKEDFVRRNGDNPATYAGPALAGRFAGQFDHQRPTWSPVDHVAPGIVELLVRHGLPVGARQSSNIRDVTQSVSMNPLQALRDLHAAQVLAKTSRGE